LWPHYIPWHAGRLLSMAKPPMYSVRIWQGRIKRDGQPSRTEALEHAHGRGPQPYRTASSCSLVNARSVPAGLSEVAPACASRSVRKGVAPSTSFVLGCRRPKGQDMAKAEDGQVCSSHSGAPTANGPRAQSLLVRTVAAKAMAYRLRDFAARLAECQMSGVAGGQSDGPACPLKCRRGDDRFLSNSVPGSSSQPGR